jgi:hypothetical protein
MNDTDYIIKKRRSFHSKSELAKNVVHASYFVDFNGNSYDLRKLERNDLIRNDYRFSLQSAFYRKCSKY